MLRCYLCNLKDALVQPGTPAVHPRCYRVLVLGELPGVAASRAEEETKEPDEEDTAEDLELPKPVPASSRPNKPECNCNECQNNSSADYGDNVPF